MICFRLSPRIRLQLPFGTIYGQATCLFSNVLSVTPDVPLNSEFQARFARPIGQCRDSTMKCVSTTIKNDFGDPLFFGPLGDQFADARGVAPVSGVTTRPGDFFLQTVRGDERYSRGIIDDLRIDVAIAAKYRKPWATAGTPSDAIANAEDTSLPLFLKPLQCFHDAFTTFAAANRFDSRLSCRAINLLTKIVVVIDELPSTSGYPPLAKALPALRRICSFR